MSARLCVVVLAFCGLASCARSSTPEVEHISKLHSVWEDSVDSLDNQMIHTEKADILKQVGEIRAKRQTGGAPVVFGNYPFQDTNRYARIHYSGDSSPVIVVLTYAFSRANGVTNSNLYRSVNYGQSFELVDSRLEPGNQNTLILYPLFHVGNQDKNLLVFAHYSEPKIYFSNDEGFTWQTRTFTIPTLDATSLNWNTKRDNWALCHDPTNDVLYVTEDIGLTWTRLSINVDFFYDYQWGNPDYFDETSVFYNTFNPADKQRGNYTVGLFYQTYPYNNPREVDPTLGRHDDFLMVGPYIFAQKTDANNVISLYVSYKEGTFKKAMIPAEDPHQNYYVAHINELQALVIVEHDSGQNNLYLSDETGVYFSLSLPGLVVEPGNGIDLEVINGVNGTLIANQFVSLSTGTKRTVISLDNGGNWELVVPPDRFSNGSLVNCDPPQCSLHLHMTTSDYARLGVYSLDSAPGLIIAHGTTGTKLADNPNLYLSRDGGVTWEHTLDGSWGVTVADHGGLLVAARDYHYTPSTELQYTCSEGQSWTGFQFSTEGMTVYGVITEPGEYTTTVSFYGVKQSNSGWEVISVNFSSIYPRTCAQSDFYNWQPWDERTDTDCILGADVSIERRKPSTCCLIGPGYVRTVEVTTCQCTDEDFDCDYGYKHADGFAGTCIRDELVNLDYLCADGQSTYMKSSGYRKIPGDVCVEGVESTFLPQTTFCSSNRTVVFQDQTSATAALGALFAIALLAVLVLIGVVVFLFMKNSSLRRRYLQVMTAGDTMDEGRISFRSDTAPDTTGLMQHPGTADDDEPLPL